MDTIDVIVVEDDASLREATCEYLQMSGLNVTGVGSGMEFFEAVAMQDFAVVVLDLGLPDLSGQQITKFLRRQGRAAVIVLTASNTLDTRVESYQNGADIFMSKPVEARELFAAISSLAKRALSVEGPIENHAVSGWQLQAINWTLISPSGVVIRFTAKEFQVIEMLAAFAGASITRDRLCLAIYGRTDSSAEAALATLIKRVRTRIERAGVAEQPILTAYGIGYRFAITTW